MEESTGVGTGVAVTAYDDEADALALGLSLRESIASLTAAARAA